MIGKWFKTDMYKGWGVTMNKVILIVFFSVYSSYFYCGQEAIASDYTSGGNDSNGKKRRYATTPSEEKSPDSLSYKVNHIEPRGSSLLKKELYSSKIS